MNPQAWLYTPPNQSVSIPEPDQSTVHPHVRAWLAGQAKSGHRASANARADPARRAMKQHAAVRERLFKGSPSQCKGLTFSAPSSSANLNCQAIPAVEWKTDLTATRNFRKKLAARPSTAPGQGGRGARKKAAKAKAARAAAAEAAWSDCPSSYLEMTWSRTTNCLMRNLQDIPNSFTTTGEPYNAFHSTKRKPPAARRTAERALLVKPEARARCDRERGFIGSPTSYKQLSFSSSANRHIVNKQCWKTDLEAPPPSHSPFRGSSDDDNDDDKNNDAVSSTSAMLDEMALEQDKLGDMDVSLASSPRPNSRPPRHIYIAHPTLSPRRSFQSCPNR